MNFLSKKRFSFESKAGDADTFGVVSFTGSEGLSRLYQFDITLIGDSGDIDMDGIMEKPASFFIHRPDNSKVPFHGIIAECDMIQAVGSSFLYRVRLVPKLWRLTLTHHNQIFLKVTPQDIITMVLKDGGLTSLDFEFRLQGSYVTWEYACQYGESHYNFVCRWMEQNGIYFFFEQSGDSEKLIMTDSKMSHVGASFGTDLSYAPVSGLEAMHMDEAIQSYICRRQQVPKNVTLQDYNYRKPSLNVQGKAEVCPSGHGELYFYGDHFRTPEEGNKLAKIRSEEFLCKEKQFHGQSTVPYLIPGYTFSLNKHFNYKMNRDYLTLSMEHQGNQAAFLVSGIQEHLSGHELENSYRNSFSAIESDVQFRSERMSEPPRLHGTLSGRIDGAGSGKYAEVDEHGRYKVILPFDRSGRDGGKASAWIRMMQPYGGSEHGMHFPLHKGCEVLLTFIDGNPDRPVIAGAVANPDHPSQVTSDNQTMAKLTTSGGNKMHIEDKEGSERILMQSPTSNTWMRMGAPNDPPAAGHSGESTVHWKGHAEQEPVKVNEDGFGFSTDGSAAFYIGINYKMEISGISNTLIVGGENKQIVGEEYVGVLGGSLHVVTPWDYHISPSHKRMHDEVEKIHGMETNIATNATRIRESEDAIVETYTKACANETKIGENATRIRESEDAIVETYTKACANETKIGESATRIRESEDAIVETYTKVCEAETKIGENSTKIAETKEEISTSHMLISENITTIAEMEDSIAANKTQIVEIMEVI